MIFKAFKATSNPQKENFRSQDLTSKYDAVVLAKAASVILGGKGGGGRKDFAQAGGVDKSKIEEAFKEISKKIN